MNVGGNRYALEYRRLKPGRGAWHVLTSSDDLQSLTGQLDLLSKEHRGEWELRVLDRSTGSIVEQVS